MPSTPAAGPGLVPRVRLVRSLGLGAFAALVAAGTVGGLGADPRRAALGAALATAGGVPLFLVGSRLALVLAPVATAGVVLLGTGDPHAIVWFALVVLTAWSVLRGGVVVGVACWASVVAVFGSEWLWAVRDPGWAPWSAGVTVSLLATLVVRHELLLVERLRAAQAELAERSRADERARIAHELHDVIAHSLTVSLLHVTSARLAVQHDPADAARALAEAERLGRQSLAEVRSTMGLLAAPVPGEAGTPPPVPGLNGLPGLVEGMRRAGAEVCLTMEGDLASLPDTAGATVYRIVQEALTNAAKHAPGAAVSVQARARDATVEVSIDSAGPPGHGSGMGIGTMAARAAALGGTCRAGPGGRGWLVQASLPRPGSSGRAG